MRKVKKMLSDTELLREINRQKGKDATNGVIDETVIETIMSHIPLDFQIKPKSGVDKKIKCAG